MPDSHPIGAGIVAGPHQITHRLALRSRDRHRGDLAQPQQPGRMRSVFGVLTRSPAGRCNFDGAATRHSIPALLLIARASPKPVGPAS